MTAYPVLPEGHAHPRGAEHTTICRRGPRQVLRGIGTGAARPTLPNLAPRTPSVFAQAAVLLLAAASPSLAETPPVAPRTDPGALAPLDSFQDCDACPEVVVMPPGAFLMGAIPGESTNPFDAYGENASLRRRAPGEVNIIPHEHPRHRVEMDVPFAIARNEVTHAEWMACVAEGGCSHVPDHRVLQLDGYVPLGPDHPVVNVSYLDVLDYVAWLNGKAGAPVYRLPTEAEWEYAARAGTETPFAQGEALTAEQANFSRLGTEHLLGRPRPDLVERDMPVPVGELDAANGWGLRHMSGNVAELTLSCWSDTHLGLASDGAYLAAALAERSCRRVAKGGAFNRAMDLVRLATRLRPTEDRRRDWIGYRIVRELGTRGNM